MSRILALIAVVAALLGGVAPGPVHADTSDFTFDSFDARYELGQDAEGRSTLHTVETLVARFPDFDQNRGIRRAIPRTYDGHDTLIEVLSVTDRAGTPRDYTSEDDGDFLVLTIAVPEGSFAHGANDYVIEYTQHDVTRHFTDTDDDEFYWDVNGTGWAQPFGEVSASVVVSPELAPALTGNAACYRGAEGSDTACTVAQDAGVFTAAESGIGPFENVTLAIGFAPGTFAAAPASSAQPQGGTGVAGPGSPEHVFDGAAVFAPTAPLSWAGIAAAAASLVIAIASGIRARRPVRTGRAIIAQYEPPEGVSVALAAELLGVPQRSMTAMLLDLAVRKRLRLRSEVDDTFGAELLEASDLLPDERKLISRIFAHPLTAGQTVWFDHTTTALGDSAVTLRSDAAAEARSRGYYGAAPIWPRVAVPLLLLLGLGLVVLQSIISGAWGLAIVIGVVGIQVVIWGSIIAVALLSGRKRLSPVGAELVEHLEGLREYIRLAEADRLRMLQSASGAERDAQGVVAVYERLLPYAVLFGQEREWQAELERYYRVSSPDWYAGATPDQGPLLPLALFTTAVAASPVTRVESTSGSSSSWSSSSGFSSSGGSMGGGFSGGGGGGGGGGGV